MMNVTVGFPPRTYQIPTIGQWLIVQQRLNVNVSFNHAWINYTKGLKPSRQTSLKLVLAGLTITVFKQLLLRKLTINN